MQGDPQVIQCLQAQLKNELTAINQYFVHYRMFEHWGFERMAKKEYEESIGTHHPRRYAGHTSVGLRTREAGQKRIAEVFYRWRLNEHLELSPDFQLIQRPGGDAAGKTVRVFGVRASAGF
jgi:hypothetical protein